MNIQANLRPEDVLSGYIWLHTAPGISSRVPLKNANLKDRTPYYQYITGIEWSDKHEEYVMLLTPEGQAKWEAEERYKAEWINKYGND